MKIYHFFVFLRQLFIGSYSYIFERNQRDEVWTGGARSGFILTNRYVFQYLFFLSHDHMKKNKES